MNEGRTLQEVAIELERQKQTRRDFKSPTKMLSLGPDGSFAIGVGDSAQNVSTNPLFRSQLAGWAGIPKKYFDRMESEAPELLSRNVNHWLQSQDETRLVRTLDSTARAFLSHRYRTIDNIDIIASVLPTFAQHGVTTISSEVTDNHLYIKGLNTRKTVEVRKGDKVQFGVVISNSEVGQGAVHVDPLVYTLACLNGAIIADCGLRKFHIGRQLKELEETFEVFATDTVEKDNEAFFLKLRDVTAAAFDDATMNDVLVSIENGAHRRIGEGRKLEEVVEVTSKRFGFNELEAEGVLRRLIDGADLTQWGLSSAVTNLANSSESYERSTDLERIGGTIATLDESEWKELAAK